MFRRTLGQPVLFAIIYTVVAAALYFSLGVVAQRALGLTPIVFLVAGIFFLLAAMTYVEGASLHQDRAGATIFARYAFNELVSFVAGWVMVLDYVILLSVTAFTATHYLAAFWAPIGRGALENVVALAILVWVAWRSIRGFARTRVQRISALVMVDVVLQVIVVVLGAIVFFDVDLITNSIDLGETPSWGDALFAVGVATVVFTGLESASGLSGELRVGRRGLERLIASATISVVVLYVGIAVIAMSALPVVGNETSLARNYLEAPLVGVAEAFHGHWSADPLKYVIAAAATATLIAAAGSAMLGLSRLSYALSTNRQIPSALGRLHPRRGTPYVVIVLAAIIAGALVLPHDLEFLVGLYAFGGLLGLTIAHLSIVVLRYREPARPRAGAQAPVPEAAVPAHRRRRPAAAGGRRRGPRAARVGQRRVHPQRRAVGRLRLARGRDRALRRVPRHAGQAAAQARRRAREGAARRAPRRRVRLDPRADLRLAARRRHRADGGAPRRRGGRRVLREGPRRDDRGAVGLRGADVAADRRGAAGRAAQAGARRARARQGGGGGVRGRRGRHGDRAGAPCGAGDRRRGEAARRAG